MYLQLREFKYQSFHLLNIFELGVCVCMHVCLCVYMYLLKNAGHHLYFILEGLPLYTPLPFKPKIPYLTLYNL